MPLLGSLATLALALLFYILAKLSERFGTVIKMQPIYRYYYIAAVFVTISFLAQLFTASPQLFPIFNPNWSDSVWFLLLAYHLPLTIGVTISLVIAWRYWSWLVIERDGK